MRFSLTGFATNANVSGMVGFYATADQPAPIHPIYTVSSCRTSLFTPSRRTPGSATPTHHREAAAMELQDSITEPDFCNAPLPLDL